MKNKIKALLIAAFVLIPLNIMAAPFETTFTDFFFLGDMHNYDYASHVDLDHTWIGTVGFLDNSLSWNHSLPGDLNPAGINRARLWIDAAYVGSDGNEIAINGFMDWDPLNHSWFDNSYYDLTDIAEADLFSFWGGGDMEMTVFAGEGSLRLDNSLLLMDYSPLNTGQSNNNGFSTVPEPTSFALLGLGIAGVALVRRRKK